MHLVPVPMPYQMKNLSSSLHQASALPAHHLLLQSPVGPGGTTDMGCPRSHPVPPHVPDLPQPPPIGVHGLRSQPDYASVVEYPAAVSLPQRRLLMPPLAYQAYQE